MSNEEVILDLFSAIEQRDVERISGSTMAMPNSTLTVVMINPPQRHACGTAELAGQRPEPHW
jgi:hypothetical protein